MLNSKSIFKSIRGPGDTHQVDLQAWLVLSNLYAGGALFGQYKMMKNDWNPGRWVLMWGYSMWAIQEYQHKRV